jgi:hypothetical protein
MKVYFFGNFSFSLLLGKVKLFGKIKKGTRMDGYMLKIEGAI